MLSRAPWMLRRLGARTSLASSSPFSSSQWRTNLQAQRTAPAGHTRRDCSSRSRSDPSRAMPGPGASMAIPPAELSATGDGSEAPPTCSFGLEAVSNFRDIAWIDSRLKPGRVMRCAQPGSASEKDVTLLFGSLQICELLDLRSEEETSEDSPTSLLFSKAGMQRYRRYRRSGQVSAANPHLLPTRSPMRHNVSILNRWRYYIGLTWHLPGHVAARSFINGLMLRREKARQVLLNEVNAGGLGLLYKVILDSAQPEICRVMRIILTAQQSGRAVLIFCKAGKDRTGLISALVLAAAGCTDEQIVQDYGRSDSYRKVALAGIENKAELRGLDFKRFEGAPAEAMQEALQYMRRRHGSPLGYLTAIGFGTEEQSRLRKLLCSEDWGMKTSFNR